jgi:hypothetical protein
MRPIGIFEGEFQRMKTMPLISAILTASFLAAPAFAVTPVRGEYLAYTIARQGADEDAFGAGDRYDPIHNSNGPQNATAIYGGPGGDSTAAFAAANGAWLNPADGAVLFSIGLIVVGRGSSDEFHVSALSNWSYTFTTDATPSWWIARWTNVVTGDPTGLSGLVASGNIMNGVLRPNGSIQVQLAPNTTYTVGLMTSAERTMQGAFNQVVNADSEFIWRVGSVAGIPEPGTWGMLIAGFGLVGAAARRRNRRLVAA